MKTILVLTDFSIRTNNVTYYALKLAQKIKANLLVCNVFMEPSARPMATQLAWPTEDYDTFWEGSAKDMNALTGALNEQLDKDVADDEFRPVIELSSMTGFVADDLNEIGAGHNITLAVVAMQGADGFSSSLLGKKAREIIEKANYPVLLVPNEEKFSGYKKIAFATDLEEGDINVLNSVCGFAKHLNAEILIAHVTAERPASEDEKNQVKRFLKLVSIVVNYPMIYYRAIYNASVTKGLQWLSQHGDIDLLVVIHRKRSFLQRLFAESITQNIAKRGVTRPVLVFPCAEGPGASTLF